MKISGTDHKTIVDFIFFVDKIPLKCLAATSSTTCRVLDRSRRGIPRPTSEVGEGEIEKFIEQISFCRRSRSLGLSDRDIRASFLLPLKVAEPPSRDHGVECPVACPPYASLPTHKGKK
ncbi:hypothetical protein AVEN_187871-1 [Araneus ventricosus]|uniref:Uncharacterized protein n=1 Tax=Araneus ventricosus TaxID=182803 RepID=A0A4Y2CS88_ARAVE|nr:hypothetical protein AVEN_187871-1 [Araneus ventricosus]